MPRFYFDIQDDGGPRIRDEDGEEVPNAEAARKQAISILPEVARMALPDGNHHVIRTLLRDEEGRPIFRGTLTFEGEWLKT